jgi:hypothetical protein
MYCRQVSAFADCFTKASVLSALAILSLSLLALPPSRQLG